LIAVASGLLAQLRETARGEIPSSAQTPAWERRQPTEARELPDPKRKIKPGADRAEIRGRQLPDRVPDECSTSISCAPKISTFRWMERYRKNISPELSGILTQA
jgi:hypothetical protein